IVAPVERRSKRLVPAGACPTAVCEEPELIAESSSHLLGRQYAQPCRGQLERQREAVESGAYLRNGRRICLGEHKPGGDVTGTLDQQATRVVAGQDLRLVGRRSVRQV